MGDGSTTGIWIGEDEDLLERFDEQLATGPNAPNSRSDEIKRAMELHLAVDRVMADYPELDLSGRALRATVRQALLDHLDE